MKNLVRIFIATLFAATIFSSCGNSMEDYAEQLAEMDCKIDEVLKRSDYDFSKLQGNDHEEYLKLMGEKDEIKREMEKAEIIKNEVDIKNYRKAYDEEKEKCMTSH